MYKFYYLNINKLNKKIIMTKRTLKTLMKTTYITS